MSRRLLNRWLMLACFSAGLSGSSARAELIVTIRNAEIPQAGTGFVDVFIRSTGADLLNAFSVEFAITSLNGRALWFADPQSDGQLDDPNYIFAGDSAADASSTAVATIDPRTTYNGIDGTDSGNDLTVPTTDRLLARLDLSTLTSSPPNVGDQFTISLLETGLTGFFNSASSVSFTASSGTVVIAAAGVPEPSSLLLAAGALGVGGLLRRRSSRR